VGEHGNGSSGFIKGGEVLDWMSDFYLLTKSCATWS